MAGLFRKTEKKFKWDVNLAEDMAYAEKNYSPYILYFRQFRQLRHDFANFAQGIQWEYSELDYKIQLKKKQKFTEHMDTLLFTLCGRIAVQTAGQNTSRYELCPDYDDFLEMGTEKACRWKTWLDRKRYYIQMEKELPHMKEVLMLLKERMERRLEVDTREVREFLSDMDAVEGPVDMDNPVMAVLFQDILSKCQEMGIEFRFKLEMPENFTIETMDLYYICDRLLYYALESAREEVYHRQEDQKEVAVIVSFKAVTRFDIWHMQVEYPYGTWQSEPPFEQMFWQILKKYKLTCKTEIKDGNMQIHLIH